MEAITAFVEGPLCFVILYGMLKQRSWRFTLQFAVSLGQLYGDVLYFATSYYDGMRLQPLQLDLAQWMRPAALVLHWQLQHCIEKLRIIQLDNKFASVICCQLLLAAQCLTAQCLLHNACRS